MPTTPCPPNDAGIGYVPQDGSLFPHLTVAGQHRLRRTALGPEAGRWGPGRAAGDGGPGRARAAATPTSSPAASNNGWPWPGPWPSGRPWSSWTSPSRPSTPVSGPAVRSDVQDVLRDGGVTAVLVTHDQDEALSVADQVAVIRDGVIGQCGTPQELYDHPVDPAMAGFLGDANLVPATVDGDRVMTPFGSADPPVRAAAAGERPARSVALVRPEQLTLSPVMSGAGLRATVLRTQFHGHDTVITVRPEAGRSRSHHRAGRRGRGGGRRDRGGDHRRRLGPGLARPASEWLTSSTATEPTATIRSPAPTSWMATRTRVRPGRPPST